MTERQKYLALIEAALDQDIPAFKEQFIDLFLEHVERQISDRAEELGFLFQPGLTFENEQQGKVVLFKLGGKS
jgi:hypothetical protein